MTQRFDRAVDELQARGGGLMSTYYRPPEFVTSKFWDAVNFLHRANPDRRHWKAPPLFSKADAEKRFQVLQRYVEHAKTKENVRFVTARELPSLYQGGGFAGVERSRIAAQMTARQTFLAADGVSLSQADMLLALLGMGWRHVDGPAPQPEPDAPERDLDSAIQFERAKADVVSLSARTGACRRRYGSGRRSWRRPTSPRPLPRMTARPLG